MKDNVYILSTGENKSVSIAHQVIAELKQAGINYFYYQEGDYKDSAHSSITDIYAKIEEADNIVIVLSEAYINGRITYNENLNKDMLAGVFCFLEIHHIMKKASQFANRVHIIAADDIFLELLQNNQIQPLYEARIKEYVQLSQGLTSTEQNRLIGAINDIDYFVRYVRDLRHHTRRPYESHAIVHDLKEKMAINMPSTLTPYILNQQSAPTVLANPSFKNTETATKAAKLIETTLQAQTIAALQKNACQILYITGKAGYGISTLAQQIGLQLCQSMLVYFITINQRTWRQDHQNLDNLIRHLNELKYGSGHNSTVIVNGFVAETQNTQQADALLQGVKDNKYNLILTSSLSEYSLYMGADFSSITHCLSAANSPHYHHYYLPDSYTRNEQAQFVHNHQQAHPNSQYDFLLTHLLDQGAHIGTIASLVTYDSHLDAFLTKKIAKYQQEVNLLNYQLNLKQLLEMVCLFTQHRADLLYQQSFDRDSQFIQLLNMGQFIKLGEHSFTGMSPLHDTTLYQLVKEDEYECYCNIINHFNQSTLLISLLQAKPNNAAVDQTALLRAIFSNMDTVLQRSTIHEMHALFEAVYGLGNINDQKPLLEKIYHHFAELTLDDPQNYGLYQALYDQLEHRFKQYRWPFACLMQLDKNYSYWQHGQRSKRLNTSDKYSLYYDINAMVADIDTPNPSKNAAIHSLLENFPVRLSSLQHTSLHNTKLHNATSELDFYRLAAYYRVDIGTITETTKAKIEAYIREHLTRLYADKNMTKVGLSYIERRLLVTLLFLYSLYTIDNVLIGLDLKRIYAYLLNKHYFNAIDYERLTRLLHLKGLLKQEYFALDTLLDPETPPNDIVVALLFEYQLVTPSGLHQFINYSHTQAYESTPYVWLRLFSLYADTDYQEVFTKHQAWLSQQLTLALTNTLHTIQIQDDKHLMKVGGGSTVGTFWPYRDAIIQFAIDTDNDLVLHQCLIIFAYRDLAWAHLYDPHLDDKYLNLFNGAKSLNLNLLNLYTNLYNMHQPCLDSETLKDYLAFKHSSMSTTEHHSYSLAQEALFDVCHGEALTHYARYQKVSQHILATLSVFYNLHKEDSRFIFPHNLMLELTSSSTQTHHTQEHGQPDT